MPRGRGILKCILSQHFSTEVGFQALGKGYDRACGNGEGQMGQGEGQDHVHSVLPHKWRAEEQFRSSLLSLILGFPLRS